MRSIHGRHSVLAVFLLLSGCSHQVRYVYQDHDFGVIGMPENSDEWPTRYRSRAENLMKAQFPEGHEIVRAEEVVEGTRMLTTQGANSAEILPTIATPLLQIGKLGHSSGRTQADKVRIKECRIIYRRTGAPAAVETYAPLATLTPTRYVDPNEAERHPKNEVPRGEPSLDPPRFEDDLSEESVARPTRGKRERALQD
jgi:hypothetical protein